MSPAKTSGGLSVTCADCGAKSTIAAPSDDGYSADADGNLVVVWKCPAADEDGTHCGASNTIVKED